jgi:hypothetical protein
MKSKSICKKRLSDKIRINMIERKYRGWSQPQAIAISYSQVIKSFPKCKSKLKRSNSTKKYIKIRKSSSKKSTRRKSRSKNVRRRKSLVGSGNFFSTDYSRTKEHNQ